ncbi:MAG: hypothetical protein WD851_00420 [Pirellulales bacterium]
MSRRRSPTPDLSASRLAVFQPPAGAPTWVTPELIEKTIRVWQRFYEAPLTAEDALGIILNVSGLVEVLSQRASS